MNFRTQFRSSMLPLVLLSVLILLTACARGGGAPQAESQPAESQPAASDPPLDQKYANIVVYGFEAMPDVLKDYPDAARECQVNVITDLQMKNVYQSVAPYKPGAAYGAGTLLVKARIKEMRQVSTAARIWGGAFAGSSYMNMDVSLIDAGTGQEVRKKELNSSTNAYAAAWTSGASDRSLPADMGKIIAEFIVTVVPKN
ncbi:MAG: DUF4410 domain-containing protein [Thermodesulfobacteriota bacterium]